MLKKLMTPFSYSSGISKRRWRSVSAGRTAVVLVYHRIDPPTGAPGQMKLFGVENGTPLDVFESHLRFMLKHFEPRKTTELWPDASRRPGFAVTFDDGYADNLLLAAPVLKRLGVPATIFLSTGLIGTDLRFWWEVLGAMLRETDQVEIEFGRLESGVLRSSRLPPRLSIKDHSEKSTAHWLISEVLMEAPDEEILPALGHLADLLRVPLRREERDSRLLNWDQAKQLLDYGFEIGAHGHRHVNLGQAAREIVRREVEESVEMIQSHVGEQVRTFAYPYGGHKHRSEVTAEEVQKFGFDVAFTTDLGVASPASDALAIPRLGLTRAGTFACAYHVDRAYQANLLDSHS